MWKPYILKQIGQANFLSSKQLKGKSLKAETKVVCSFPRPHKIKVGSAIRQLYIKIVLYMPVPNSHKQGTFLYICPPPMPGIEFSNTGGDCGVIQWPQAAAHPVRSPLLSSLLSLRTCSTRSWASRPLWQSGLWWLEKRQWGNSAESSRWCQQKVCT